MPRVAGTNKQIPAGWERTGLEILFAKPGPRDHLENVAERELDSELRERFWIRQARDLGTKEKSWAHIGVTIPMPIERAQLDRNRNRSGDGFWYVFRSGTAGTGGRAEWFEVTEVFEGVEAKDIKNFMRLGNGGNAHSDFDPERFLRELKMGRPSRASQRRAADGVLRAVEKKLTKSSYKDMAFSHGYGTLIVGLPLWFPTNPLNPLRVENVIDDFTTRIQIGLQAYERRLRRKDCPFWRIVVVWKGSEESVREWTRRARLEIYNDPAYRRIGSLPVTGKVLKSIFLKLFEASAREHESDKAFGGITYHLAAASPEKKESQQIELPAAVAELRQHLAEFARTQRKSLWERVKMRSKLRIFELLCFVKAFGINGLQRWLIARLSPRRRLAQYAMRRRAIRLYRASRQRSQS